MASIAVADLTDNGQLEQAIIALDGELGGIDVLVNNAGIGGWGPVRRPPDGELDQVLALNLVAAMRMTRRVLPGMIRRRRDHIVNVGSVAGRLGAPFEAIYSSVEFGLTGFTERSPSAPPVRHRRVDGQSRTGRHRVHEQRAAHRAVRWPAQSPGVSRRRR